MIRRAYIPRKLVQKKPKPIGWPQYHLGTFIYVSPQDYRLNQNTLEALLQAKAQNAVQELLDALHRQNPRRRT